MTYLITGATGNIGGKVADQLVSAGHRPRILARDPAKARDRFGERVDVAVGDLARAPLLRIALQGVDAVFLVNSGPELAERDAAFAGAAKVAGIRHIVKLSSMAADREFDVPIGRWHLRGEEAIAASGLAWTFLRPGTFMSNCLSWTGPIKSQGAVFAATGDGKVAAIHPEDIAAVATAALTEPGHAGQTYTLTGPEALTYADMTAIIAKAIGKPLRLQTISDGELRANVIQSGAVPAVADSVVLLQRMIREGALSTRTDDVQRVLGRAPRSFEAWVMENASTFR